MPYTTEQRRENLARARAVRKLKEVQSASECSSCDCGDLKAKVEILWLEREAARAAGGVKNIPYQCVECKASVMAPHPMYRSGDPNPVECPNRHTLHQGNLTEMDYTP